MQTSSPAVLTARLLKLRCSLW